MRFLINYTIIFFNPTLTSGIPRVVRKIVDHAKESYPAVECIPVFYKGNSAYIVKKPTPGVIEAFFADTQKSFHQLFEKYEARNNVLLGQSVNTRFRVFSVLKISLNRVIIFLIRVARFLSKIIRTFIAGVDRGQRIEILIDDVIVMLDASWQKESHRTVARAKSAGSKVVCVIHDLIPVSHPHLFNDRLVSDYNLWLDWIIKTADGYMSVSKTTRDKAQGLIQQRLAKVDLEERWFDYFYLGSELDLVKDVVVRDHIASIFNAPTPVYLMVSTIEPRKNHEYLLDAFTELWNQDYDLVLCFIGRIGWKCDSLVKRVQTHPELDRRLFMLNDVNDNELEYAYQHSRALLFSSIAEGFGLPLVEAMQRGLPVMASDIPIFREVGGDYCAYFNLDDPQSLAKLIAQFESTNRFPAVRPLDDYEWLTWQQATENFLKKISNHVSTPQ